MNITLEQAYKLRFDFKMVPYLIKYGKRIKEYNPDENIQIYYIRYENNIGYAGLIRDREDFNVIKNIPLPLYSISIKK